MCCVHSGFIMAGSDTSVLFCPNCAYDCCAKMDLSTTATVLAKYSTSSCPRSPQTASVCLRTTALLDMYDQKSTQPLLKVIVKSKLYTNGFPARSAYDLLRYCGHHPSFRAAPVSGSKLLRRSIEPSSNHTVWICKMLEGE